MSTDFSPAEIQELEAELNELGVDFEEMGGDFDEESFEELSALDQELAGSGLDIASAGEGADLNAMTDDPLDAQFFGGWIKRKVARLLRRLIAIVRRYRNCRSCIGKVRSAVILFKRGRYIAALRAAYRAYACIRRCVRR
ncbi:MAG: hypothetical protein AAGJ87_03170 [Pseudomonadota bacterium]